jgi:hypothetical protein
MFMPPKTKIFEIGTEDIYIYIYIYTGIRVTCHTHCTIMCDTTLEKCEKPVY